NKNAAAPSEQHNRVKNYILPEGEIVPPLVDMGIFTPDGKVVPSRYDKYKQINRFLEMMDDTLGGIAEGEELHVVDFGCGKSYLTFILYHYLYKVKGIHAVVTGVDLKADVIADCNRAAKKYGYDGLSFVTGDIAAFQPDDVVDVVVSLHACDTATDYALYNAVAWNAKHIFSVPCCQHELNKQMTSGRFSILTRYGIIQERFAAMATDAIRANLLTAVGYKTQMLEFVDLAHTPKNLLLRGSKCDLPENHCRQALQEAKDLMDEFSFKPTLFRLLGDILA
ncbi:MAG: SAM-dependent methyltransferase, partial [Victivallales bacterium]|nr:SAM-dependent methyltransferase [Victivallales bacterium]